MTKWPRGLEKGFYLFPFRSIIQDSIHQVILMTGGGWVDVVRTLKSSVTFFKQKSLTNTKKMRFTEVYWRDVILSVS